MCLVTVRFYSYDKLLIWQVLLSKSSSLRILFLSHSFYSSGVKTCTTLGITRSHLCFMKFGNKTCLYCPAASNGLGYQQVSFSENMTCRRTVGQPCRTQITDRTTLEADNGGNEEKKKKGKKFSNLYFWRHFPTWMVHEPRCKWPTNHKVSPNSDLSTWQCLQALICSCVFRNLLTNKMCLKSNIS